MPKYSRATSTRDSILNGLVVAYVSASGRGTGNFGHFVDRPAAVIIAGVLWVEDLWVDGWMGGWEDGRMMDGWGT
ncbi:hypothetical protein AOQ84DRAFT_378988 [Glonium stellatum]|uniref:Uncharacterized protein n=1 Tax=Glonium stellatum TaxID=574774 RepID=A0A8E2JQV0_9PEZI|nr:hypothetical protein AOQ84DRAFT_378988 [Glonium stellatum]